MSGGSFKTRQLGSLCRIYKNSSGIIIAIDDIVINADTTRLHKVNKFHQSAHPVYSRQLFYLGVGDRTIDTIEVIGDFSSIEVDGGNYSSATWSGDGGTNDAVISFARFPVIGETV